MTTDYELPPLPEWTDWPSTVSDMSVSEVKEAMQDYARTAIEADRKHRFESGQALEQFRACKGDEEPDSLERLRFYCSLAMSGRDWLDVEPFFDALEADRKPAQPAASAEPVAWLVEHVSADPYATLVKPEPIKCRLKAAEVSITPLYPCHTPAGLPHKARNELKHLADQWSHSAAQAAICKIKPKIWRRKEMKDRFISKLDEWLLED